ncbi:dimethylamine monooxygenase subunit DmmA family protein [Silvanigrella sp.]|jgi:hypothetical protein|uniref:dimethylamine monooxygenase subunit DmmA family protein n=1 Tax=Silvanigrella sp. TaxID=2024976 RepID=UPI0037CC6E5D
MERGYSIKSKPIYSSLIWNDKASFHLIIAQGIGAMSILKMFQIKSPKEPTIILYSTNYKNEKNYVNLIQKISCEKIYIFENDDNIYKKLYDILHEMFMGLSLYVVGSENFIWTISKIADKFAYDDSNIIKELANTLARSVYCVHCKVITNDIKENIIKCYGCGRMLFIREHFSRRFGAYMGVMANAESPYDLPEIEEIYP